MRTFDVPVPDRIAKLPIDHRGYPVPWFVAWLDEAGEPVSPSKGRADFRVIAPGKVNEAVLAGRCWICGESVGRHKAYVVGPMCAVNRTSAEPPSHRGCAIFAAQACPFLANPQRRRQELNKPEGTVEAAGIALKRNPGVALVWVIEGKLRMKRAPNGILFDLGEPSECLWYAHGREATRAEVEASIDSGLPILRELAEDESPAAVRELERLTTAAMELAPT